MAKCFPAMSEVFQALGDPTRCAIVSALGHGEQSVSALAAPFDMALPSFMKHLAVLERCGLIRTSKLGRTRTCELVPDGLTQAGQWLASQRAMWEKRSDRMANFVENLHVEEQTHGKRRRRS